MFLYTPRNFSKLYNYVLDNGTKREDTTEIINFQMKVKDPVDRVVTNPGRKMSVPFAIADTLSYFYGVDDLEFFTRFVPRFSTWSSDEKIVDDAYGPIINSGGKSQIDKVAEILKKSANSRRAIISIYQRQHTFKNSINTPCTLNLHLMVVEGKLDMIATMRSNDIVWGFSNDMFAYSFIQEYISKRIGIPLGTYYHNAHTIHVYDKHNTAAYRAKIAQNPLVTEKMWEMPAFNLDKNLGKLFWFYKNFHNYKNPANFMNLVFNEFGEKYQTYWRNFALAGYAFVHRKMGKEHLISVMASIHDNIIKKNLELWIK